MPSFEIPDGPTTAPLKSEGGFHKGSAVFGVTNKTSEGLTARLSVQVQGDGKAEWYQVQGDTERAIAAGETQTVTVVAKIPGATPPGTHRIRLRAINVNDPDNDSTDSSATTVTVPAPATNTPPPSKPFPWWILAVAGGVLALVIAVIIAIVVLGGGSKVPEVTARPYDEAVKILAQAGYGSTIRMDQPGDQTLGTVVTQTPLAGTKAYKSTTITLVVATAKPVVIETPPPVPPEPNCDPAVGTCIDGFTPRGAWSGDLVCVPPESRDLAQLENAQAAGRRNPSGGPYGPDTCLQGFVWRDGRQGDHVCVTGERRTIVAVENQAGSSRRRACRPGSP